MRVVISASGKLWFFHLARELLERGHLARLITGYPKFEAKRAGIPRDKVRSILLKEVIERSWRRLPRAVRGLTNAEYYVHELYDRIAARRLEPADIVTGNSSAFLETLRAAKKMGAMTIVERGSSHIRYQERILMEEYALAGLRVTRDMLAHPRTVDKELREYEEADRIYTPSAFTKRTFLAEGVPAGKIIQVPFGVDLEAFHPVRKEDDVFRVVFTGSMSLRKGTHYLLQAFAELGLPKAELLLIGTMREEIRPFFRKYAGRFNYIGPVPHRELYRHLSQGSVFAIPSIEEGLALVQAQAMACGLPVIATVNTGGEDIIREGMDGFIIPIRDVDALKAKIQYLYDHPEERARMGASAKQRVASGFTWHDYGDRIVSAYRAMLASRRS